MHLNKEKIVILLRRYGGATVDAILDLSCHFFSLGGIEGFIGYRRECGCAIMLGDPVCSIENRAQLTILFHLFCLTRGLKVLYLIVSESFSSFAIKEFGGARIEFGEALFLDPQQDPRDLTGVRASLVRRKVRHAQKEGLETHEYLLPNSSLEAGMEKVAEKWLLARDGPQVHISHPDIFENRYGKRWIYAMQHGQVVGVAILNKLESKSGWLLNHLMFAPEAPHGTPESLVIKAIEILKGEECHFLAFAMAPLDRLGRVDGLGKISGSLCKCLYSLASKVFHLQGHKGFWEKFNPQSTPAFLYFHSPPIGFQELIALKKVLNISI